MESKKKKTILVIGILLAVAAIVIAVVLICGNRKFERTSICPDDSLSRPSDTTYVVNGVAFKMVGIQGGIFRGEGLKDEVELPNFYIGETEVTWELWYAVMGRAPQLLGDDAQQPVSNVTMDDCFDFLERLDSITGVEFYLSPYEYWLYAAYSGKTEQGMTLDESAWYAGNSGGKTHPVKTKLPDAFGLYDMAGNVAEWTISGPDPLFIVAGGGFEDDSAQCGLDSYTVCHANVHLGNIGFRIICIQK